MEKQNGKKIPTAHLVNLIIVAAVVHNINLKRYVMIKETEKNQTHISSSKQFQKFDSTRIEKVIQIKQFERVKSLWLTTHRHTKSVMRGHT